MPRQASLRKSSPLELSSSQASMSASAIDSRPIALGVLLAFVTGVGYADVAKLSVADGTGPNPQLPEPNRSLLSTVHVASAVGWSDGEAPGAAAGLEVSAFASGLDHPRWLYVLPNGDVLVAETNAPPRPEDQRGITGWIMGMFMKRAGARGAEREPHHVAARRGRRRRSGAAHRVSSKGSTRRSAWRSSATICTSPTPMRSCASPTRKASRESTAAPRKIADLPAGSHESPLDEERHRKRRRLAALRHRGLEQQRRRTRHGERGAARRDSRR